MVPHCSCVSLVSLQGCSFFLRSALWKPCMFLLPLGTCHLSQQFSCLRKSSSQLYLKPVRKHIPVLVSSHQQVYHPHYQKLSLSIQHFSICHKLRVSKGLSGLWPSVFSSLPWKPLPFLPDCPPHTLPAHHSGPDPEPGASFQTSHVVIETFCS